MDGLFLLLFHMRAVPKPKPALKQVISIYPVEPLFAQLPQNSTVAAKTVVDIPHHIRLFPVFSIVKSRPTICRAKFLIGAPPERLSAFLT
jgi:hypothetical protein